MRLLHGLVLLAQAVVSQGAMTHAAGRALAPLPTQIVALIQTRASKNYNDCGQLGGSTFGDSWGNRFTMEQNGCSVQFDYNGHVKVGTLSGNTLTITGYAADGTVQDDGNVEFADGGMWTKEVFASEIQACANNSNGMEYYKEAYPTQERVALLLRGQSFHKGHHGSCFVELRDAQLDAAQSLLDKIVSPLERQKLPVDLFVTDQAGCNMSADELAVFRQGGERNVQAKELNTSSQETNIRAALDWFKQEVGGIDEIRRKYKLVIVTRHDLRWLSPIDAWPTANMSNFNFLSRGIHENAGQVNDIFHMMPGNVFPAWDRIVGKKKCFNPIYDDKDNGGHECACNVAWRLGAEHISFVTPWQPKEKIHEESDVVAFIWHSL